MVVDVREDKYTRERERERAKDRQTGRQSDKCEQQNRFFSLGWINTQEETETNAERRKRERQREKEERERDKRRQRQRKKETMRERLRNCMTTEVTTRNKLAL